jgi:hypothetical protein
MLSALCFWHGGSLQEGIALAVSIYSLRFFGLAKSQKPKAKSQKPKANYRLPSSNYQVPNSISTHAHNLPVASPSEPITKKYTEAVHVFCAPLLLAGTCPSSKIKQIVVHRPMLSQS